MTGNTVRDEGTKRRRAGRPKDLWKDRIVDIHIPRLTGGLLHLGKLDERSQIRQGGRSVASGASRPRTCIEMFQDQSAR